MNYPRFIVAFRVNKKNRHLCPKTQMAIRRGIYNAATTLQHSPYSLLFIWQLQAITFLLVFYLQGKAEQECQYTKRREDNHWHHIAIGRNNFLQIVWVTSKSNNEIINAISILYYCF